MKKTVLCVLVSSVALLAAMGLVFLWCCPEWHSGMLGEHWRFKRQLCWNAIGMVGFCIPLLAGWARWLRLAPALAVVWLVLFAVSQFSPHDGGGCFVLLGPIRLDVFAMLPFTLSMLLAWILHKLGLRAIRMLLVVGASILLVPTVRIATNANRVSRVTAWFSGNPPTKELAEQDVSLSRAWAQMTCVKAVEASHWFSANEAYLKENPLPGRLTFAMPAAASLTFGRWFLALTGVGFAALMWCFVRVFRTTTDYAKRMFLVVAGLGVFAPAILGVCECFGVTPMLYTCMPLVPYSGTLALMTWITIGSIAAIVEDDHV